MSTISNELILGLLIGYFLQNYLIIFILGLCSGIFIVEKYGPISNICKWSYKSTNENIREVFSAYIRRKPVVIENNTVENENVEKKTD
jgi:hypothetical protein